MAFDKHELLRDISVPLRRQYQVEDTHDRGEHRVPLPFQAALAPFQQLRRSPRRLSTG